MRILRLFPWLFFTSFAANAQLTIQVVEVPSNTPQGSTVYVAGSFNNWSPGNAAFALTQLPDKRYTITFQPAAGVLEFKFTRGSWATVEGNLTGGFLPNRTYNYGGGKDTLSFRILSWEDLGSGKQHTATPNVTIMDDAFGIPQLGRSRRIWVYLPPDYATSGKRYPVLYLQDGQNLFDAYYSFAGEWKVDESLNDLFAKGDKGIIVVGIDNGGATRIDEYAAWKNNNYMRGGEGGKYTDFIANTLKPYIDSRYRTRPEREQTGIGGSSLGGLISFYAAIKYQHVFGKALVFSPSFWFNNPEIYRLVRETGKQFGMRMYLMAGGEEEPDDDVVFKTQAMLDTLKANGCSSAEAIFVTHPDGRHAEWYWSREFPAAYQWLFADNALAVGMPADSGGVRLYPNPVQDILHVALPDATAGVIELFDTVGRRVFSAALPVEGVSLRHLPAATYRAVVTSGGRVLVSRALVKQ